MQSQSTPESGAPPWFPGSLPPWRLLRRSAGPGPASLFSQLAPYLPTGGAPLFFPYTPPSCPPYPPYPGPPPQAWDLSLAGSLRRGPEQGPLHDSCCVAVTLLPFLALAAMQSSCNPRSLIHNSGCSSHWRLGGGEGGGHGVSLPPGLAGCSLAEAVGAGEPCLPLPPPPSPSGPWVPAQRVPFSFSPQSPSYPLLLTALPCHAFPPGLCPPLSPGPQSHFRPSFCESLAETGQRHRVSELEGGHLRHHQSKPLLSQVTRLKAEEEKAQCLSEQPGSPDRNLHQAAFCAFHEGFMAPPSSSLG